MQDQVMDGGTGKMKDRNICLDEFARVPETQIRSTGYVIDTLEAAVWCLITTQSFEECLLKAVNLGDDADTTGAVAGGLAGLYYGYDAIPREWLAVLQKREWVEELCTWDYRSSLPVTDIHIHLIPGIDDGCVDIAMSMEMIRSEYRQGVRGIICTPHADGIAYDRGDQTKKGLEEIRLRCRKEFPDLRIGFGCELFLSPSYMDECLEWLEKGTVPSMNGTGYVLAEFSQGKIPFDDIKFCVTKLKEASWVPVIAHAERYTKSYRGMEDVRWLKENGCLIQINLYSLDADPCEERKEFTRQMVREKLSDFVGTDAHRLTHRPAKAAGGMKVLTKIADPAYAQKVAFANAAQLLCMESFRVICTD